ncbi:unnamed protein product, partial [marine sediment metagenome]
PFMFFKKKYLGNCQLYQKSLLEITDVLYLREKK